MTEDDTFKALQAITFDEMYKIFVSECARYMFSDESNDNFGTRISSLIKSYGHNPSEIWDKWDSKL